jgi:hypothetical protein
MKRIGKRFVAVAGMVLALNIAVAEDSPDRRLKSIAGNAVDCGRIGEQGVPRPEVVACGTRNVKVNRPFHARLDTFGEDSAGGIALVLADRGNNRVGTRLPLRVESSMGVPDLKDTIGLSHECLSLLPRLRPLLSLWGHGRRPHLQVSIPSLSRMRRNREVLALRRHGVLGG